MQIIKCEQYSPEWWAKRRGKVTASGFSAIVTPDFKARTGQTPKTYMHKLVAERALGFSEESTGQSLEMRNGSIIEHECFGFLNFEMDMNIRKAGFILSDDGECGFSPDGLGDDYGAEIKCPSTPVHIQYLLDNELPEAYRAQVYFSMYVGDFSHYYFVSYSRQMSPLVIRLERDRAIDAKIKAALDPFIEQLNAATAKIKQMRQKFYASKEAQHEANSR